MKLVLALSLVWMLSSSAGALQCTTCNNTCSNTIQQNCTSETECFTAASQVTAAQTTQQQLSKGCTSLLVCPNNNIFTYSFSTVSGSFSAAFKCCNTDNCNSANMTYPDQSFNSLQCFTCDSTDTDCTKKLQCKGEENRCFTETVKNGSTTTQTRGCMSADLCSAASTFSVALTGIGSNVTCCKTSLCNSGPKAATISTFLLLGLLAFKLL